MRFLLQLAATATALLAAPALATTAADVGGCGSAPATTIAANPSNYRTLLAALQPGQTLQLAAGTYTQGLPFDGHHGAPGSCIAVQGPEVWPPAVRFTVTDCCNTVSLRDSSYLLLRNLEIDGTGNEVGADGVKAEGDDGPSHHVTLENLWIHDFDTVSGMPSQGTVCISTKSRAWRWVIRASVLERCGTGMYLGNSDGEAEFVGALIEHNLVTDTIGYGAQIKHQNGRATGLGIPASAVTILRHNVFAKAASSSSGGDARPNLLVGHFPLSGAGSDDDYLIYGNFFWQNPNSGEALFQGEGNVFFYDNLLVNDSGPAVRIQPHNDVPRRIRVLHNTVVASGTGISVTGGNPGYTQLVIGNAVFAATPVNVSGMGASARDNTVGTRAQASTFLAAPFLPAGAGLDLYPRAGGVLQGAVDASSLVGSEDGDRDFDLRPRAVSYRGAYAGEGTHVGWSPALVRKPGFGLPFRDGFEDGLGARWSARSPL